MRECENVHTKNLKKEKKLFKDSKKIKVVFPFSLRTFLYSLSGLSRFFIVFCLIDFERQTYIFTCNTILKNYMSKKNQIIINFRKSYQFSNSFLFSNNFLSVKGFYELQNKSIFSF